MCTWKQRNPKIPTNFKKWSARLKNLVNNPKTDLKKYDEVIQEQLTLGIIERAPKNSPDATVIHYLPHRGIDKNDKLRIVYDASAKTENNPCLNDLMEPGPVLTEDMVGIFLNFRIDETGVIADAEKAFLQIGLNKVDRDAVRFLWLKNINLPVSLSNLEYLSIYQ